MSRNSVAPRFADWILARFVGRERAAALVGDLLEEAASRARPALYFWPHAAWLIALFTVRSAIAYYASLHALFWIAGKQLMATFGEHTAHRPPFLWIEAVSITGQIGTLLFALTAFSLLRFGPRAHLTWISLGLAAATLGATFLWWVPAAVGLAALVLCLTLAAAFRDWRSRRTLAIIATAATAAASFFVFVCWVQAGRLWAIYTPPLWLKPILYPLIFLPILTPIIPAAVASALYSRWILRSHVNPGADKTRQTPMLS